MTYNNEQRNERSERSEKTIYAGSGKKQSDKWIKITIDPTKIQDHIQEFNGRKFVKLNINIGEVNQYGKDVSISIDTWRPDNEPLPEGMNNTEEEEDDRFLGA